MWDTNNNFYPHPRLPDKHFNKKPNIVFKKPEKSQTVYFVARRKSKFFVVLLFLCHEQTPTLKENH